MLVTIFPTQWKRSNSLVSGIITKEMEITAIAIWIDKAQHNNAEGENKEDWFIQVLLS